MNWKLTLADDFDRLFGSVDTTRATEIHTHACAQCPSVLSPADPETLDYMAASKEEQLGSVFRCAWRTGKACRGYCDLLGVTEPELAAFVAKETP